MQRKRGELVPIREVFDGLDGPVKAIRDTSPQALFGASCPMWNGCSGTVMGTTGEQEALERGWF